MISDIIFSAIVGFIPTASMITASLVLFNKKIPPLIEACFQNFCAGLILAAVAAELFPLVTTSVNVSSTASTIGVTAGFLLGVAMLNGVEILVEKFEHTDAAGQVIEIPKCDASCKNFLSAKASGMKSEGYQPLQTELTTLKPADGTESLNYNSSGKHHGVHCDLADDGEGEWEYEPVKHSVIAIASPEHRNHIRTHFGEIMRSIDSVQRKFTELVSESMAENVEAAEHIAEAIDEEVHRLQYMLDHVRRLLEGSEAHISHLMGIAPLDKVWWTDEDRKRRIQASFDSMKYMCTHLVEHVESNRITIPLIREMHQHVDDMEHQISSLHMITEEVSFKWRRATKAMPDPAVGSTVPASLIIPVTIDGFVDGFMIGIACAVSRKAGVILSCANCLEMAFLGMAVSVRVRKCTGSTIFVRYASILGPPLVMFFATLLGTVLGSGAKAIPILFVTFVSFGIVALLFLVCNELLTEARKVNEEEGEQWWVTAIVFLGVWVVIALGNLEDGLLM